MNITTIPIKVLCIWVIMGRSLYTTHNFLFYVFSCVFYAYFGYFRLKKGIRSSPQKFVRIPVKIRKKTRDVVKSTRSKMTQIMSQNKNSNSIK